VSIVRLGWAHSGGHRGVRVRRVLVVHANAETRSHLVELLEHEGYQTTQACDGAEALTAAERYEPDLILLGVMLPKVNAS
jgi:CheY-like chemotaxis protein